MFKPTPVDWSHPTLQNTVIPHTNTFKGSPQDLKPSDTPDVNKGDRCSTGQRLGVQRFPGGALAARGRLP